MNRLDQPTQAISGDVDERLDGAVVEAKETDGSRFERPRLAGPRVFHDRRVRDEGISSYYEQDRVGTVGESLPSLGQRGRGPGGRSQRARPR